MEYDKYLGEFNLKSIIVYGSKYGTAKRYAEKLSEMTNIPAVSYKKIGRLKEYDLVIHFGSIYAGGIKGLKKTVKSIRKDVKLIIATVGLYDINDEGNVEAIKKGISSRLSSQIMDNTTIFNLRGSIDYEKLSFAHKQLIKLLCKILKSIPEDKKMPEQDDMLKCLKSKADFVDFSLLDQIVDEINSDISKG
mgnify:FL=1